MAFELSSNTDGTKLLDSIDIELSGYCNASCVFCPRDKISRTIAILGKDVFVKLLQEISSIRPNGPQVIYLTGLGEPLHNKNIFSFVDDIRKFFPSTRIAITSNGTLLTKETCDAILASNINSFQCSIQSIHKDQYEAVMGIQCLESVIRWMTYLAERRKEFDLDVSVSIVRTTQTTQEVEEYRHFWRGIGVSVCERKVHNRGGFLDRGESHEATTNRSGCGLFNSRLFVAGNGDILACCHDLDGQSRLGTIGMDSLLPILVKKLKMAEEKKLFPMCAKCNDSCGQY